MNRKTDGCQATESHRVGRSDELRFLAESKYRPVVRNRADEQAYRDGSQDERGNVEPSLSEIESDESGGELYSEEQAKQDLYSKSHDSEFLE
jgi:hypothetical protein